MYEVDLKCRKLFTLCSLSSKVFFVIVHQGDMFWAFSFSCNKPRFRIQYKKVFYKLFVILLVL